MFYLFHHATVTHLAVVSSVSTDCPNLAVIGEPGSISWMKVSIRIGASTAVDRDTGHRGELSSVENVAGQAGTAISTRLITEVRSRLISTCGRTGRDASCVFTVRRAREGAADRWIGSPVRR